MNSSLSRSCRVCKSTNNFLSFKTKNYSQKNSDLFEYFTCRQCDSLFLKEIPNNINKYYSKNYHAFKLNYELSKKDKANIRLIKKINFKKVKIIKNDYLSIMFSKYGWETSGYYKSKDAGKKFHSYLGKFFSLFMPYIEAIFKKTSQYTIIFTK